MTTKVIYEHSYHGFESISDLERDVSEAIESSGLEDEFQGAVKVTITYEDTTRVHCGRNDMMCSIGQFCNCICDSCETLINMG